MASNHLMILNFKMQCVCEIGPHSPVGNMSDYRCASAADPGVASLIPARSHTFVEIDHEIISTVILLPSADSFKKQKYMHELLVIHLFKLAQEKCG